MGGANIRDVAARAGVSPMTVSRVINREQNVKPETRELVDAAIRALNYAPNPAARSLAGSAPLRVALLYHNPSSAYLSELLVGSLDASARAGAQLVVEKCPDDETMAAAVAKLIGNGVDGLVLPPPMGENPEILALLEASTTVMVAIAPGQASQDVATVRIDNQAAAVEVTRHLLDLGHRRLAYIKGDPNQSDSDARLEGFVAGLKAAGLSVAEAGIEQGYNTYRSGLEAAERLLSRTPRPTAIFAGNDDMAAAAAAAVHRMGLDVPGDISIVGFDDTPLAGALWPALTTVHQPIADMARAAVELVLAEIRRKRMGEGAPQQLLLPYQLIVRESTGPAPSTP